MSSESAEASEILADYLYQLFMNKSDTECTLMVLFSPALQTDFPLGEEERLIKFPKPLSVIMGEKDWMISSEDAAGKKVVE